MTLVYQNLLLQENGGEDVGAPTLALTYPAPGVDQAARPDLCRAFDSRRTPAKLELELDDGLEGAARSARSGAASGPRAPST